MGPARVPPGAARSPAAVRSLWRDAVGWIIPVSARGRIRYLCRARPPPPAVPREPASGGGHVQAEALLPRPCRRTPCRAAAPTYAIPPVQALPAGPGQSPRSRELRRLAARRGSGEWDPLVHSRQGPGWRRWTCRQPGAARRALPPVRNVRGSRGRRSPPCGRPLFPGPLNRWAGPRARMGGPTGRTGGSRQTNWLRATAIRRSDGFPGALRDLPAALTGTGRPDSAALESHGAVQSNQYGSSSHIDIYLLLLLR